MTLPCYLALDQGTTSSRALVFDATGRLIGKAQYEFAQHFPAPGWVEHDPEQIWQTQQQAMLDAWASAGRPEIGGVGITNQRETVVVFDRQTAVPIYPAVVWQDRRTTPMLEQLKRQGHEDLVRQRTGLPLDPYFSAAKIAWILDRVPGARAAAERGELAATTIDGWLLHRLTRGQVLATEPSNASRTALYDLHTGGWSSALAGIFAVPLALLPEIRPSAGRFGEVAGRGWPITAMLGDQQAALFGQGCVYPGSVKCTYGTGAFLLRYCGSAVPKPAHGLLATVAWRLDGRDAFALEGSVMICGALIQWLRDALGLVRDAAQIEALARSVEDSGGITIVPAFAGLGTPHWDPDARGLIIGLTRGTTGAHVARAALEAIACQVKDVLGAMERATGEQINELRVDGGAAANDLLLELQATLLGARVVRSPDLETTAFGVARLAMVGAGACRLEDLPALTGDARVFAPGARPLDCETLTRRWQAAVERSGGWARV